MKYLLILALLVTTVLAEEKNVEMGIKPANLYPMNMLSRMRYSMMGYGINPPMEVFEYYSNINDEDFPIDYSQSCSNTCHCRTVCVMYWWVPCTCTCPPPCNGNQNNNRNNNNRFPPTEWEPEPEPPRFPNIPNVLRTTTPPPSWNRPQIPPRWPTPEIVEPNYPVQPPVHPWNPNPQPIEPPIWNPNPNPNPWDPRNPMGHPTHPPQHRATTSPPVWWVNPNQPNNPPNWWEVRTTTPPPVWWMNPNNPINNLPNLPIQQPNVPMPEPINPPRWNQPPQNIPNPPNWRQPIEEPCNDNCSCVPCTIIWVCPPACSTSCCAARGFKNAENDDNEETQN